jgi:hypothetical protein
MAIDPRTLKEMLSAFAASPVGRLHNGVFESRYDVGMLFELGHGGFIELDGLYSKLRPNGRDALRELEKFQDLGSE